MRTEVRIAWCKLRIEQYQLHINSTQQGHYIHSRSLLFWILHLNRGCFIFWVIPVILDLDSDWWHDGNQLQRIGLTKENLLKLTKFQICLTMIKNWLKRVLGMYFYTVILILYSQKGEQRRRWCVTKRLTARWLENSSLRQNINQWCC